jgi:hypothetical protein
MKYRVMFQRSTSVELYLEVEADNAAEAVVKANKATEENDDQLVEIPESYSFDCGPTGEVTEIEGDDEG